LGAQGGAASYTFSTLLVVPAQNVPVGKMTGMCGASSSQSVFPCDNKKCNLHAPVMRSNMIVSSRAINRTPQVPATSHFVESAGIPPFFVNLKP
jgi:hypothetical protein